MGGFSSRSCRRSCAGAGEGAGEAAEKTEFDVVLKEIGEKKINIIKEVRAILALV